MNKLLLTLPLYDPYFKVMFLSTIILFFVDILLFIIMIELDKRMYRRS